MEVICAPAIRGGQGRPAEEQCGYFTPAYCFGHMGVVHVLLSAGARADLRDEDSRTPLDALLSALRPEVEHLVQQAKEEGGSAVADKGRVGAPSAPAAVLPTPHYQSASQ